MKKIQAIVLVAVLALCALNATAQTEKEKDIRKLMVSTGMADMSKQIMAQMIGSIKQSYPDVPEKFWTEFMAEVKTEQLIQMMIPIYSKFYSHEEVKALTDFYNTPVGQKTIRVMPALMQESYAVGQQWGLELGQKVANKLEAEGY